MPQAGSVIRWRTSTLISAPNTSTPRCRTLSVVSSAPRRREPETKSARLSRIGCDHAAELLGLVLAVGVDRGDDLRPARAGQPVAQPQRRALATVDRDVADQRAGLAGPARRWRPWRRRRRRSPRSARPGGLARDLRDHLGDGRLLVVGGDHDRQRRAGAGRMGRQERRARRRARRARAAASSASTSNGLAGAATCSSRCWRARLISALRRRQADGPEPANTASRSICDHSCHTPTSPSSKVELRRPAGRARLAVVDDHRGHLARLGRTVTHVDIGAGDVAHGVDDLEHRQRPAGADHHRARSTARSSEPRRIAATTSLTWT